MITAIRQTFTTFSTSTSNTVLEVKVPTDEEWIIIGALYYSPNPTVSRIRIELNEDKRFEIYKNTNGKLSVINQLIKPGTMLKFMQYAVAPVNETLHVCLIVSRKIIG